MLVLRLAATAALVLILVFLVACKDDDADEKQTANPKPSAQAPSQQSAPDGHEDDENPTEVNAAAAESLARFRAAGRRQLVYNFDSDSAGQLPQKFHAALTGSGSEVKWAILADPSAPSKPNVVAQTSTDKTDYRFPLLIGDEGSFRNLDLSVRFKAVSGNIDRAGGLVFRLKDPNNYYIVRANALENNYRLYHVVNGRRSQFAGANLKVTSGEWHELRVEAVGNKITCYYDGSKKIEATDDTFRDAGKIGLWTKADSVTYFDDLKATAR
jgi:Domain of Unknown Function (DUF1080)